MSLALILRGLCPACHKGKITRGLIGIAKVCPSCGYDLQPEAGYYLGAMMVSFFVAAALTIPPMIAMKFANVDETVLSVYPFVQYAILGPLLARYAKVIWAHIGYHIAKSNSE